MARGLFGVEFGHSVLEENGDALFNVIGGTAVPDGTSGEQQSSPIGTLYVRSGTGELYQKIANAGAPADYELNAAGGSAPIGNWRPERVDALTGQVLTAGVTNPVTWSDNDGGFDGDDATVGHYVLDGNCALWEITVVTSSVSITLAAASSAPVADDMFAVKYYLPDPAGQENQAIVTYDGAACIKVADVDFASATAINIVAPYTPVNGTVIVGDSVQGAIEKLDGNQQDIQTSSGIAQGAVDYGTFTGAILPDNATNKALHQAMETAVEEIDQNVDDLITLSGVAENSTDLGTFTGDTIPDNSNNKEALQALETELEAHRTDVGPADIAQNTATVVDSVLVDDCQRAEWEITAHDIGTPGAVQTMQVSAFHNGSSGADATIVKDRVYDKDKIGSNFNFQVSVVLSGAAGTQAMDLTLETSDADGIRYTTSRLGCVKAL